MTISVRFDGVDHLIGLADGMAQSAKEIGPAVVPIVAASALRVEQVAKQFVPYKTGATRDSIGLDPKQPRLRGTAVEVDVGAETHYAPFLEHGTARMAPHAFLGPALDRATPDFVSALELVLAKHGPLR